MTTVWPTKDRQLVGGLLAIAMLAALAWMPMAEAQTGGYQGFGASTPGGAGGAVVHVTNLNDSGPGSLREALSQGNRRVVFDVTGTIALSSYLYVQGPFVTIDGLTAPSPGITLRNWSLVIAGSFGAHDVIVQGLRVRASANDGIMVKYGAYNVVIDHVSVAGSGDGNIDITQDSRDVTVSWSILAGDSVNMLIKYNTSHVSLHHNLFVKGMTRNPLVSMGEGAPPATTTTADIRNNLIWGWGSGSGFGTWIQHGARANIVSNFYKAQGGNAGLSLYVDAQTSARAYTSGNFSADGLNLNGIGGEANAFSSPPVDTQSACPAAQLVVAGAGMRPLDSVDTQYLADVALPFCQSQTASLVVSPSSLAFEAVTGAPAPPGEQLSVVEAGGGRLTWVATATTTSGGSWLAVTPASGTTPSSLTVSARPDGLAEGAYQGTVVVTSPGATNSPRSVPVTLVIDSTPPPPPPPEGVVSVEADIDVKADDAREYSNGVVRTGETSIDLGRGNFVALRFGGVDVPPGAVIESAVLELYGLSNMASSVALRYLAEDIGNSPPLGTGTRNLSTRPRTQAFVDDVPALWQAGTFNSSPELRSVIQEVVARSDWDSGHSLTLFIADIGSARTRRIGSFESSPSPTRGARLTILYQVP
jgi:pectate lyase